jgi:16S rRNA (uracil1498-N3)-methyltransferase
MRRAWVEPQRLTEASVGEPMPLPEEAAHHLLRVLRLAPGALVELFDGEGRVARGTLTAQGSLAVAEVRDASVALPPLVVAQALVRGPKLEEVARRCTELGASEILVYEAGRSQAPGARLDRLDRIVKEAARQCERDLVPRLSGPSSFEALVQRARGFGGVVALGVVGAARPLSSVLEGQRERFAQGGLLFVVGPEGGLALDEQARLLEAGGLSVALGAHVLRTETAGLAALACAQAAAGLL